MMKRRQSRIICLSSGAREGTPWDRLLPGRSRLLDGEDPCARVIRDVALELAEYNITVNAMAPGPTDTERTGPGLRRLDATVERSPSKMTPLGRLGTADEVAAAALSSPQTRPLTSRATHSPLPAAAEARGASHWPRRCADRLQPGLHIGTIA
jgi:NAD(P)-dependent dehydrogenase (short-subunit alcohol dehydrogenase family)